MEGLQDILPSCSLFLFLDSESNGVSCETPFD